jgi:hypothetical protein
MNTAAAYELQPENIPDELKAVPQWVCWRGIKLPNGKLSKIPVNPKTDQAASTDNPASWGTFHEALLFYQSGKADGIGFVFTSEDPYFGIDLDDCMDAPGRPALWTLGFTRLKTYTEVTVSRTGLHIIGRGKLPQGRRRKGHIEMYDDGRFFVMTGYVLPDHSYPHIRECSAEIHALHQYALGNSGQPMPAVPQSDAILATVEQAMGGRNGERVRRLWGGDITGYPSQSEADMALCSDLAFWFDGNAALVAEAFRRSGLYREKWDRPHFANGRTYGDVTVERAIGGCTSFYKDLLPESGKGTASPSWSEPIPLDDYSQLPDFPVDALPGICGLMVQTLAQTCQVDAGLPASMLLAALSTAIGSKVKVVLKSHAEQANLYVISVIGSGNRKSEVVRHIAAPLYGYQKKRQEAMGPVIKATRNNWEIMDKRLQRLRKEASETEDPQRKEKLLRECDFVMRDMEDNPVPAEPVFLVDDITPERLGTVMAENEERSAIISAEGGFFKILAGRYSNGQSNLDLCLKAHTGDAWSSDRVGRTAKSMMSPALTLGLAVQPDVIEEISRNSEFRGRGLSARFLYSMCQSRAGYRTLQNAPVDAAVTAAYNTLVESLMAISGKYELTLDPSAQGLWNEFYGDVEPRFRAGRDLEHLVDWGSKLPGAVARIGALMNFAMHGEPGLRTPICREAIHRACMIGGYYLEHAKAVFGMMGEDPRVTAARRILKYILRERPETFTARDVMRHKAGFHTTADVNPGLLVLVERGYIAPITAISREGAGRPRADSYLVNPNLF